MIDTTYAAQRVKVRDLVPGDTFADRPLGQLVTYPDDPAARARWERHQSATDVLRFDRRPTDRSLCVELDAWLRHAGTGRELPRKRWSGNTEIRRTDGGGFAVRLHTTDVVEVDDRDVVTLRTGGWPTMLTSGRIESFLPEGWSIDKHGSEAPWLLWTTAVRTCGRCGDILTNDPAPDGTPCWTDSTGGDVCVEDAWSRMMDEPNAHYSRPAHEIVFTEGMRVDTSTGELVEPGTDVVKSWPRHYNHGASWQSGAYG